MANHNFETKQSGAFRRIEVDESSVGHEIILGPSVRIKRAIVQPMTHVTESIERERLDERGILPPLSEQFHLLIDVELLHLGLVVGSVSQPHSRIRALERGDQAFVGVHCGTSACVGPGGPDDFVGICSFVASLGFIWKKTEANIAVELFVVLCVSYGMSVHSQLVLLASSLGHTTLQRCTTCSTIFWGASYVCRYDVLRCALHYSH